MCYGTKLDKQGRCHVQHERGWTADHMMGEYKCRDRDGHVFVAKGVQQLRELPPDCEDVRLCSSHHPLLHASAKHTGHAH